MTAARAGEARAPSADSSRRGAPTQATVRQAPAPLRAARHARGRYALHLAGHEVGCAKIVARSPHVRSSLESFGETLRERPEPQVLLREQEPQGGARPYPLRDRAGEAARRDHGRARFGQDVRLPERGGRAQEARLPGWHLHGAERRPDRALPARVREPRSLPG
jgi:hypothetical protein